MRRRALGKVAVDEGDLKKAIAINAKVDRKGEGFADVGFRKDQAFYGGFVGAWHQHTAGTALTYGQSLEEAEGEITDAFIGAMNKTIEKALGRLG